MPPACSALITLQDHHLRRQRHWWLARGGHPQRIADLLAAPLRRTGMPAQLFREFEQVFAPLPRLRAAEVERAEQRAAYHYRIRLTPAGNSLCCLRRCPSLNWPRLLIRDTHDKSRAPQRTSGKADIKTYAKICRIIGNLSER